MKTKQDMTTQESAVSTTSNEVLVEVSGLSKKFCKDLKTSLWYGVKDLIAGYSGNKEKRELRPKEFWAVKDISFTLKRGECLGLIGHNGAGKSTLLKILNGLINPDEGEVVMRGRVGALIELGAGFNPILSGRENIYNNGAILGFSRKEINQKIQQIIDFAEIEEFIDMPVRNYSSGMKVRLGFAIAAQMEPDVLIIDEVLAVGDLGFVLKCFKTIDTILPHTAIIFVSHSMPMVSRICNQIVLMDRGVSKFQGEDVSRAIDLYYTRFANNESNIVFTDHFITLNKIDIISDTSIEGIKALNWGENLNIELEFETSHDHIKSLDCVFIILDKEQRPIASIRQNNLVLTSSKKYHLIFKHNKIELSKGTYSLNIVFVLNNSPSFRANNVLDFQIIHERDSWEPFYLDAEIEYL